MATERINAIPTTCATWAALNTDDYLPVDGTTAGTRKILAQLFAPIASPTFTGTVTVPAASTLTFGANGGLVNVTNSQFAINTTGSNALFDVQSAGSSVMRMGKFGSSLFLATLSASPLLLWYNNDAAQQVSIGAGGNIVTTGSLTTAAPSGGTAGAWKTGILVTAAVVPDTTRYIQLDVGGTLYKVIIST